VEWRGREILEEGIMEGGLWRGGRGENEGPFFSTFSKF
jgi:hypothetical protein